MNNQFSTGIFFKRNLCFLLSLLAFCPPAIAQKAPKFAACNFDATALTDEGLPAREGIVTAYTFSQNSMTNPSLWWTRDQFGEGKLLVNWIAKTAEKQIDLVVNWQLWSVMGYVERYSFINHFGTVAREYGYQLRVFNQRQECLAIYNCDPDAAVLQCAIDFDPARRSRFRL